MMRTSKTAYLKLIEQYFNHHHIDFSSSKNILLVFQGFPLSFYEAVALYGIKHFSGNWDYKYPDYKELSGAKLLSSFIASQGAAWAFYEEIIALSETLNDFSVYGGTIKIIKNDLFNEYYPLPIGDDNSLIISSFEDEKTSRADMRMLHFYSDYKIESGNLLVSYVNRHFSVDIGIDIPEYNFFSTLPIVECQFDTSHVDMMEIAISALPEIKCALQNGGLRDLCYQILGDATDDFIGVVRSLNALGGFFNVQFSILSRTEKRAALGEIQQSILRKYWGADADFRFLKFYVNPATGNDTIDISQETIIADVINQCSNALSEKINQYSDIIVTAPTGAGKSIFFQIPGIYLQEYSAFKALTVVICPLVALMIDQVKELNERGIEYATYINSALTYEERQSSLDGIKSGRYSIVYLSPELLLAYDIRSLIGNRRIGLLVVDEAHLVTSWGRDFRVDYWFLGDYIEKIRRGSFYSKTAEVNFPVLCLTATAVFGGRDDIVGDLQNSLHLTCYSDHMYIGYVRRDNIQFVIRHPDKEKKSDKEEKLSLTTKSISQYVEDNEKTIVYFPYKSQVEDVRTKLASDFPSVLSRVEKYYSGNMKSIEKDDAYSSFRDNKSIVMLATKAFGMGVNISDVLNVYHYAPTGTLADYVQEIGRAARKLPNGYAITDYLRSDMHYAQTLWGLSGLRHYQIKAIMKKLYSLYAEKQHRNLLFSPETFSYLFDAQSVDMKIKSGLMLLSSDLLNKYHFKVIVVRPKNLFSKQYIVVPKDIETVFLEKYGQYCTRMDDCYPQTQLPHGYHGQMMITKVGDVFEIDLAQLWENEFCDFTFATFKYQFFTGSLFSEGTGGVVPNMKLIITYDKGYNEIFDRFTALAIAIQNTFNDIKRLFGGRSFTSSEFVQQFRKNYSLDVRREYILMLLELFCYDHIDIYETPSEQWKFIERRKAETERMVGDTVFCIRTQRYGHISANLQRYFKQAAPNNPDGTKYVTYLNLPKPGGSQSYQQLMASVLQLFDFASYEFIGGRNPQIFVRINDPIKLRRIIEAKHDYRNSVLTEIEDRHKRAVLIMNHFMAANYSNEERWGIIEDYFLGNDEIVDASLEISQDERIVKTK